LSLKYFKCLRCAWVIAPRGYRQCCTICGDTFCLHLQSQNLLGRTYI
jgi:hypothetical protein